MWKVWCKGKRISLEIEEYETAELNRLLEKFYAGVKNKYNLPALPPRHFVFFIFILLISNHTVFLGISAFWKLTRANNFRIYREKPYDYLYKLFAFLSSMFKATKYFTLLFFHRQAGMKVNSIFCLSSTSHSKLLRYHKLFLNLF